jgi:hypothetical protein
MADQGNLQVVEAMMVAMLLLGAAYGVLTFSLPTSQADRTRGELGRIVSDGLTVLAGLKGERGSELDAGILDAMQGNNSNLTLKLGSYLPSGVAYAVLLDNGAQQRDVVRAAVPPGEAVTSTVGFSPDWNLTFVTTELSCYDAGMAVNATLLPIVHGTVVNASSGGGKIDGTPVAGERSAALPGAWNLTLTSPPATGTITASMTARSATVPGSASYASCNLGGPAAGAAIVTALRSATVTAGTAPVGGTLMFDVDTTGLLGVATMTGASLWVYEPLPAVGGAPDGYAAAAVLPVTPGVTASVPWDVPSTSLYGAYPVVLRVNLTAAGSPVQARVLTFAQVALPSGVVPIEPTYRIALQAWFRDWR